MEYELFLKYIWILLLAQGISNYLGYFCESHPRQMEAS